jgi:hypothetical protein
MPSPASWASAAAERGFAPNLLRTVVVRLYKRAGNNGGTNMPSYVGGCLCGAVRYTSEAEPIFSGACHCRDCQRFTGSAFAVVVAVPSPSLKVEGATTRFTCTGDSGKPIHRMFCPTCGSGLFDEAEFMPGVAMLSVGTLDDPDQVQPLVHVYCARAQPWVAFPEGAVKFRQMPPPAP